MSAASSSSSGASSPPSSSSSVSSSSSSLPPPPAGGPTPYPPATPSASGGAFLDDINPETLPPDLKKEGPDWFAIFNPKVKRVLDVNLTNTLNHERHVPLPTKSTSILTTRSVSFVAFASQRTASILRPGATEPLRSTIRRLGQRSGALRQQRGTSLIT